MLSVYMWITPLLCISPSFFISTTQALFPLVKFNSTRPCLTAASQPLDRPPQPPLGTHERNFWPVWPVSRRCYRRLLPIEFVLSGYEHGDVACVQVASRACDRLKPGSAAKDHEHKHKQTSVKSADLDSPSSKQWNTINYNNLVRPKLTRHCFTPDKQLVFSTLNVRSLRNIGKADAIRQLRSDKQIDVLFLTETWHETSYDVSLRRLRNEVLQIHECARPVSDDKKDDPNFANHEGIAIVAPTNIRIAKLPFTSVSSFECLCAHITSQGSTCAVAVIYRPGSQKVSHSFLRTF